MRDTAPATTQPATNNNTPDLKQLLSAALQVSLDKSWPVIKALLAGSKIAAEIIIESMEGAALGYQIVMLIAYSPKNDHSWEYTFPASGLVITFTVQSLELFTKLISHRAFRNYCMLKQSFAGALDGANFAQAFMPPNNWGVVGGNTALVTLFSSKVALDLYRDRPFFHSVKGKFVKHSAETFYMLMMGAGIFGLLFQLIAGFDPAVGAVTNWSATIGLAMITFLAYFFKTATDNIHSKTYKAAQFTLAGLYGMSLGLFLTIMQFDIAMDARHGNSNFNPPQFGGIIGAGGLFAVLVTLKKIFIDLKEEQEEQEIRNARLPINRDEKEDQEEDEIENPVLEINREEYEVISEPDNCQYLQSFKQCWASLWHCRTPQHESLLLSTTDQSTADRSCSERISSWLQPLKNLRFTGFNYQSTTETLHQNLSNLSDTHKMPFDQDDCYLARVK